MEQWLPKSVLCLRHYTLQDFLADLPAGITVGLVALPLAMAFAIASGLSPQSGIYCAVVTGFIISALGGSKVQIGGPTGAFVVVVAAIVAKHGIDGLFMCTMMAGILLFVMGATGLGAAVKFIPRPVVLGFTNGIAILIASTQVKDFFGLRIEHVPGDFYGRMKAIVDNFSTISWEATVLGVLSIVVILATSKTFAANSGIHRRPGAGHDRSRDAEASSRNHWHAIWRNTLGATAPPRSSVSLEHGARADIARHYRRHAGCD